MAKKSNPESKRLKPTAGSWMDGGRDWDALVKCLPDKVVSKLLRENTWDGKLSKIKVCFTDGTYLEVYTIGGPGCEECNPDGAWETELDVTLWS